MMKDDINICERAVEHYGPEHQKKKAIEEMGELITALAREQDGRATAQDVITEIADVIIMVSQMAVIYGTTRVEEEITSKLYRLKIRMDRDDKSKD